MKINVNEMENGEEGRRGLGPITVVMESTGQVVSGKGEV